MYDDQFHSRFLHGPLGSLQFDWMHCYCVSGAMNHENRLDDGVIGRIAQSLAIYFWSMILICFLPSFS